VDYGGKVAFDLRGSQVIVTRADEASHEDPAIASFLALLEKDIRTGTLEPKKAVIERVSV
jgi:antitoxin PrlF